MAPLKTSASCTAILGWKTSNKTSKNRARSSRIYACGQERLGAGNTCPIRDTTKCLVKPAPEAGNTCPIRDTTKCLVKPGSTPLAEAGSKPNSSQLWISFVEQIV